MNIGKYSKAVLAFATLVASNALADLAQSGEPWPTTGGEWARWAATILGGTLLVFGKGNSGYVYAPEEATVDEPAKEPKRRPVI